MNIADVFIAGVHGLLLQFRLASTWPGHTRACSMSDGVGMCSYMMYKVQVLGQHIRNSKGLNTRYDIFQEVFV